MHLQHTRRTRERQRRALTREQHEVNARVFESLAERSEPEQAQKLRRAASRRATTGKSVRAVSAQLNRVRSALADAAARYAAHGWHVFPLVPRTKDPFGGSHGFRDATTDPDRVAAWWHEHAYANIGLHPGPSGLAVVDCDGPRGLALAKRLDILPESGVPACGVETGRADGGVHAYFQRPAGDVTDCKLARDVLQVRCVAGYVVLPPSVHPTGRVYRWVGSLSSLGQLPGGVRARLLPPSESAPKPQTARSRRESRDLPRDEAELDRRLVAYLARCPAVIGEGERNERLHSIAFGLAVSSDSPKRRSPR